MNKTLALLLVALSCAVPLEAITITEIMYNPRAADEAEAGGKNLEWIELYNEDPTVLNLSGYYFSNGVSFLFPPDTYLEGRSYLVVCADEDAVRQKYGITNTIGNFALRLDNGGETIALNIYGGGVETKVRYSDRDQWPQAADGTGHSLVLRNPYLDPDDNDNWTWSNVMGGTPGGPNFDEPTVVETEIMPDDEVWKYLKGTAPYPAGWKALGFNDSSWLSGQTGIGYGDGDDRTELSDMRGNYWSFAARHVISLTQEQIDGFDDVSIQVSYDDGFVLYLNGTEIARGYLGTAGQDVAYDTAAGLHEATGFDTFTFSKSLLVAGDNILAAQVNNNTLGSSDSSFIPRLVSTRTIFPNPSGEPVPVVINECFSRTGSGGWIELYNTSPAAVDVSGFHLSDDSADLGRWTLPAGSTIAPRGFLLITEAECGLNFAGEELAFYLTRPDLSEVIAAELFESPPAHDPPLDGTSDARLPDGKGRFFVSTIPTPGAANEVPLETDIVINEIMYNPPRERPELEFIELYNRADEAIDIGGFRFTRGVSFTFPPGTVVPAGGYVVVAADPQGVEQAHSITGVLGPYGGQLANNGERVRLVDPFGNIVDEVRYYDGGRWSPWADGGGSSLELLDPWQDNSVASAWEASDESGKSSWEIVEFTISYAQQQESEFQIRMLAAAEALIDDIQVTRGATQYIRNGSFETSTSTWIIDGNHVQSHRTTEDAFDGSACLKIVATGDGDTRVNRIETETSPSMTSGSYNIHLALRWLRGGNLIYFSGFRQPTQFQKTYWMTYPLDLGSPGAPNSVAVTNLGPVISEAQHAPAVPGSSQPVTVTARVSDADGVASVRTLYSLNTPAGPYAAAELLDDGEHGDGEAGDGIYGGTIPGQSQGSAVVYYVEARDALDAVRTFPREAPDRTLLYRHDSALTAKGFTYRVIHDTETWNLLNSRQLHSNELLDASFVFNESKVYYNVGTRYRGSPWNRPGNPRMYRIRFPKDHTYRGRRAINLSRYGNAQRERASYYAVWRNSTSSSTAPMSRAAFARVKTNAGTWTMEHIEPVNPDYLKLWFPEDSNGFLFKIGGKQVFSDSGQHLSNLIQWATYQYRGTNKAAYRWNFAPRTRELDDNFEPLADLTRIMSGSTAVLDNDLESIMDVEQWLRVYAACCAQDDWDKIAIGNGQNAYVYFAPIEGRWKFIPWDMDHTWGNTNARIYPDAESRMRNVVNRPRYRRIYAGILNEMVNGRGDQPGFWSANEMVAKFLDRNTAVVGQAPDRVQDASSIRGFINGRRGALAAQLPAKVNFAITTHSGEDFTVDDVQTDIDGNGWVDVHVIALNGETMDVTWIATTRWRVTADLNAGNNRLSFIAVDVEGNLVGSDTINVTSTAGWPAPDVTAIDPDAAAPGETVTISGTEFHDGIEVSFGETLAGEVAFDESTDPTALAATVPLLPPGVVEVTVRNIDGRSSGPIEFTVESLPPHFVRGDANLDRIVDISDPVFVLGYLFRGLDARCLDALDADNDELINVTDAVVLLDFLFKLGPPPPAPFPELGLDDDGEGPLDCQEGFDPFANE